MNLYTGLYNLMADSVLMSFYNEEDQITRIRYAQEAFSINFMYLGTEKIEMEIVISYGSKFESLLCTEIGIPRYKYVFKSKEEIELLNYFTESINEQGYLKANNKDSVIDKNFMNETLSFFKTGFFNSDKNFNIQLLQNENILKKMINNKENSSYFCIEIKKYNQFLQSYEFKISYKCLQTDKEGAYFSYYIREHDLLNYPYLNTILVNECKINENVDKSIQNYAISTNDNLKELFDNLLNCSNMTISKNMLYENLQISINVANPTQYIEKTKIKI